MGPPSYIRSVVDWNVDMWCMAVIGEKCSPTLFRALKIWQGVILRINQGLLQQEDSDWPSTVLCRGSGGVGVFELKCWSTATPLNSILPIFLGTTLITNKMLLFTNHKSQYYIKNQLDATLAVLFTSHCKITLRVSDAFCVHHQEY